MAFWRSYAHLIWSTKNRAPLIRPELEYRLFACLIDTAAELSCFVHAVNGMEDHVHVVISIPPKHSVSWVVKNLKGGSSHFVSHVLAPGSSFAWQRGYGYLTLGESQLERAVAYVRHQKEHHRAKTTNGWLERADDRAEQNCEIRDAQAQGVREPRVVYGVGDSPDLNDKLPF